MKTRKIYETPMCEAIAPDTEYLCLGLNGSETPDDPNNPDLPLVGAKRGQYLFDDAEGDPEYEL